MKSVGLLWFLIAGVLAACGDDDEPDPGPPADFSGTWAGDFASARVDAKGTALATVAQQDENVSGTLSLTGTPCFTSTTLTGSISGNQASVTATSTASTAEVIRIEGTLSGGSFSGSYEVPSGTCSGDRGSITLARR